ncbi:MAG TPA: LamG domain-containing protein [Spirochaetota bacterium]|nr:LamG domain-containing protein [Spirochaetota bacterium]
MPKTTMTADYFQVPSLNITIEINSTTNASEVREVTTTEEIDSSGNKVKLERNITTNNDQNGIVTSGSYIIYKTVYNSEGAVTTPRYLLTEGEVDPNATTTTNPNATTTTTIPSNLPAPYAYYSCDADVVDNILADDSGNNRTLTRNGTNWQLSTSHAKKGNSIRLSNNDMSSSGTYLYGSGFPAFDNLALTEGFSVCMWVARENSTSYIFSMTDKNNTSGIEIAMKIDNNRLSAFITGGRQVTDNTTTISKNVWTHVSAVWKFDASSGKYKVTIYTNGVEVNEITAEREPSSSGNISIGAVGGNSGGYVYKGLLDEIRIYDTALTADQIKADMALSQ